jgi:hypothetical protein
LEIYYEEKSFMMLVFIWDVSAKLAGDFDEGGSSSLPPPPHLSFTLYTYIDSKFETIRIKPAG